MKADAKTKSEVVARLNEFADAFENRGMNDMLALYAPDPDTVFIGSGADERAIGLAQIEAELQRAWSQSEATSIKYGWTSISAAGSVAWAAADATVLAKVGGQEISFPVRLTYVFEKRGNRWLIVQFHGSVPAAGQAESESFPTQPS